MWLSRYTLKHGLLLFLLVNLCACSFFVGENGIFRDRKKDYRKSESVERIVVPEELDDEAIVDLYPVPPISPFSDGEMIDEFPLPVGVVNRDALVKVQNIGDMQWILVQVSASQAWPRLKEFLSREQLILTAENGSAGMMEAKSAEGYYRFRVEQGFQRNHSELSVRYVSHPTAVTAFWPEESTDKAKEKVMFDLLAQFFADVSDKPAYSFAAQGISTQQKMAVEHDADGVKTLVLMVPDVRAWLTVEQSLLKADFSIKKKDDEAKIFYVQYTPQLSDADKPGWFLRMFGVKPDPYDEDVKYAGEHYTFQVNTDGDQARLAVSAENTKNKSEVDLRKEQNTILLLLKERLY
jgi:uncharacterized lipoprotein